MSTLGSTRRYWRIPLEQGLRKVASLQHELNRVYLHSIRTRIKTPSSSDWDRIVRGSIFIPLE